MTTTTVRSQLNDSSRARALAVLFAGGALALGALASLGPEQWSPSLAILLVTAIAAFTFPLAWVAFLLTALVPFQVYFNLPNSPLALRVAVVLVALAAVRIILGRLTGDRRDLVGHREHAITSYIRQFGWIVPAGLFLLAALIAALGAQDRYLAFKGIYDWGIVFATAFVAGEIASVSRVRDRVISLIAGIGVIEALIGLLEYVAGLDRILRVLRMPFSALFIQPSLLNDRLADMSFNWVLDGRAVPFGTFINAIDYAIFLAATLSLMLALLTNRRGRSGNLLLALGALVTATALLLTLKGSGLVALGGGAAAIAILMWLKGRRAAGMHSRLVPLILVAGAALIIALPFSDLVIQRLGYLIQREAGTTGDIGRVEIWASLVQYVAQRPFFGYGLNNSIYITEPARTLRGGAIAYNLTSPESAYVAALVETGIAGFVTLLSLFATVLWRAWHNILNSLDATKEIGLFAACAALLLGNLTVVGFTGEQNGMLLGVLIGLVFAAWKHP